MNIDQKSSINTVNLSSNIKKYYVLWLLIVDMSTCMDYEMPNTLVEDSSGCVCG